MLIEYEVADTIVDTMVLVVFYSLKGMGMVTDKKVGSCTYKSVGFKTLPR